MSQRSLSYESDRPDSQESVVFLSTGSSSSSCGLGLSWPTSMLVTTLPFFEPLFLDTLQHCFTSFSTVYMHTSSPPSTSPTTSPRLGPGSQNGHKQLEDSSYSWGPLKSLKHAIVIFYNPDDAERACQASNRYYFPPAASTPEITLRVSVVRIQY